MARPLQQRQFAFVRRTRRRERLFKWGIIASTAFVIAALVFGTARGRLATARVAAAARAWGAWAVGGEVDRAHVEALHRLDRRRGIELTRGFLRKAARDRGPAMERFLDIAGMAPDSAVIRWGNVDWTLVLSSKVFAPDDSGRSYRLRPGVRSVWIIRITLHNAPAMFLVPDDPAIIAAGQAAGGVLVPQSVQTTNSWGCRGPEPDLDAPVRGLVLGDSMMQGLLVGDEETPPACLRRDLSAALGCRVSVLNAGVLGYSPEQYYYTLVEYFDRLRPHFVVVGLCDNDFGDLADPSDRAEAAYWLGRIAQRCRTANVLYLFVPAPREIDLLGRRDVSTYPGPLSHILSVGGTHYLDPVETFTDAHLRLLDASIRAGDRLSSSPLYNGHLGDHHFSPLGCSTWSSAVSLRLSLVWDHLSLTSDPPRAPSASHQ